MLKHEVSAVPSVWARITALRQRDPGLLAPKMRQRAEAGIAALAGKTVQVPDGRGGTMLLPLDGIIFETGRTDELQAIYYAQGTTNARTARTSWHFYRLAMDVISKQYEWFDGQAAKRQWPTPEIRAMVRELWFKAVAVVLTAHGLDWGGDWHTPDLPHFQFAGMHKSPEQAPELYDRLGIAAVWRAVGAA